MQYRRLIVAAALAAATHAVPAQGQDGPAPLPILEPSAAFGEEPPPQGPNPCSYPTCYEAADYDGDTLVMAGRNYQAVYVFVRDATGTFAMQSVLVNPHPAVRKPQPDAPPFDPLQQGGYGNVLALRGDDLAVATGYWNEPANISRLQVDLYRRYGSRWVLRQSVVPERLSNLSRIAAMELDDGVLAVKVVTSGPDGLPLPSSVSVYRRWWGQFFQEATLQLPAGSGDGPGLGLDGRILVVGATDQQPKGGVHVYERGLLRWRLVQTIVPTDLPFQDFGIAVAVDGQRIAVGAPMRRFDEPNPDGALDGIVETYARRGARYEREQRIENPAPSRRESGRFGASLALEGDRILVGSTAGAPRESPAASFLLELREGTWTPVAAFAGGFATDVALDGADALVVHPHVQGGATPAIYDLP